MTIAVQALVKEERKSLNLYEDAPNCEITLDQFEVYALKRLKVRKCQPFVAPLMLSQVLRKIEQVKMLPLNAESSRMRIEQAIKKENLADPLIDQISHYVLRLSYCQTEDLRRWFLTHESLLFQHRLKGLGEEKMGPAVDRYAQLTPISKAEKERLRKPLQQVSNPTEYATATFYAVPFTQALDLVATRQCYIHRGLVYVPHTKLVTILGAQFRTRLARTLALLANSTSNFWNATESAETVRLAPLLKHMHTATVPQQDNVASLNLTADSIPSTLVHMPLCMRQMHAGMQRDGKLKHQGRLQYGFFLRSAGLGQTDLLAFFQRHFKAVTETQFSKQYAASFAHMFKKAGGGYSGYSCGKIIAMPTPTADQHHGCPYKNLDANRLSTLLTKLQIGSPADRHQMVQLASEQQQYNLACLKHYQVTHVDQPHAENVGNHPNAWYRASLEHSQGKTAKE